MSDEQDRRAVERVLAGDPDAFAELVERYEVRLRTLAFRFCRDRDLCHDLAQTAFLVAFRKLDRYRGDAPFERWMLRLATNSFRSALRRRRPSERSLSDSASEDLADHAGAASMSAALAAREPDERVRRAVTRLPERYRDVLVLFYFSGNDVRETAAILELPTGTVKALLHRGRELLRAENLDGDHG